MKMFFKTAILATLLTFGSLLSAANPEAHPSVFKEDSSVPISLPGVTEKCRKFLEFLNKTEEGRRFLSEEFPSGLPSTRPDFSRNNPVEKYTAWYNSQFAVSGASKVALEEEAKRREAAEQLAEQQKLKTRQIEIEAAQRELALVRKHDDEKEQTLATHQASMVAILAGGGGDFTNAQVNDLVTAISTAEHIQVDGMAFDDTAKSVDVSVTINGTPHNLNVTGLNQGEYNRLKLFLAMFAKMHSAAFNAASGAMSDLITDILSNPSSGLSH